MTNHLGQPMSIDRTLGHLTVSAPAKAFLIGEYGVLDGIPALVTAVDLRAYAHHPRSHLGEQPAERTPVVSAAMQHAWSALERSGVQVDPHHEMPPRVDSAAFHSLGRKVGLGSSAAVCVSVVAHTLARHGADLAATQIHDIAAHAHRDAQGGGSGADVAAAALGGVIRFEDGRATKAALPCLAQVAFVDIGQPASTSELLRYVRSWAERNRSGYAEIAARIGSASAAFFSGWEQQSHAGLQGEQTSPSFGLSWFGSIQDGVQLHVEALRALGRAVGVDIITSSMDVVIKLAAKHGIAAKPSGAGGGDLVVLISPSQARIDAFSRALFEGHHMNLLSGAVVASEGVRHEIRPPVSSRLGRLFDGDQQQRRSRVSAAAGIDARVFEGLDDGALSHQLAENMIENVIGTLSLPVGVATNISINGRDYLVPMCVEEASVVAAASNAAKMIRAGGGFSAHVDPPCMIGQIELGRPRDWLETRPGTSAAAQLAEEAVARVMASKSALLSLADRQHPRLVARGGGAREVEVRVLASDLVVVHIVVDCRDAMGANLVNTMAEDLAPELERLTGWTAGLRILSNLSDRRCAHVRCRVPVEALASEGYAGDEVAMLVAAASRFASLDPYRAATHNKGTMNGIDAVVLATGNDWRAIEAGAHAYAARSGVYGPLCTWEVQRQDGAEACGPHGGGQVVALLGSMSIPLAVGTVGGATVTHPSAQACLALLGYPGAQGLAMILASVGMASNLAALRALATEGIQRGHMGLHARSIAAGAGAVGAEIEQIAEQLIAVGEIKAQRAQALLSHLREGRSRPAEHA